MPRPGDNPIANGSCSGSCEAQIWYVPTDTTHRALNRPQAMERSADLQRAGRTGPTNKEITC